MPKRPVGYVRGRSDRNDDISLRDYIVDGEGKTEAPDTETKSDLQKPSRPPGELEKKLRNFNFDTKPRKKLDEKESINYFRALDDIIADLYEKQGAAYSVVKAVLQIFEQRGQDVPFEEAHFNRICGNLSIIQAAKEISWLYGLGPEHADRVADHMIDRLFGVIPKGK